MLLGEPLRGTWGVWARNPSLARGLLRGKIGLWEPKRATATIDVGPTGVNFWPGGPPKVT